MFDFKTITSGNTWVVEVDRENWIYTGDPYLYKEFWNKELLFRNRKYITNDYWKNYSDITITDEIALLRPEVTPQGALGWPGAVFLLWGVKDGLCLVERRHGGKLEWKPTGRISLTTYSEIKERRG